MKHRVQPFLHAISEVPNIVFLLLRRLQLTSEKLAGATLLTLEEEPTFSEMQNPRRKNTFLIDPSSLEQWRMRDFIFPQFLVPEGIMARLEERNVAPSSFRNIDDETRYVYLPALGKAAHGTIHSISRCNITVAVRVDVSHCQRLLRPVNGILLDDAKRVNPKVLDPHYTGD